MCDEYDNRGCEVVDELTLTITDLEMTIADLKAEFLEDLKHNQYFWTVYRNQIIKKWEAK